MNRDKLKKPVKFSSSLRLKTALLAGAIILSAGTARSQFEPKTEVSKPVPQGGAPDFSLKLGGKPETSLAGEKISTRHAEITPHTSDLTIAAGDRFSLTVDVQPHSNIHIYAPGAKGYREISLSIEPNSQIRVLPLQYPVSDISTITFLDQPVPVFQKPFRLVQDLILMGAPDSQAPPREKVSMTIRGTLEYQACDDRMCFFPVSVPLAWTLSVRPHAQPETNRP